MRVQAPVQVEITEGTSLEAAQQMLKDAGLQPPLLVKPLWTDGREGSHGLAVLHDLRSLEKLMLGHVSSDLKPPLVLQQFVEHGGVLFKASGGGAVWPYMCGACAVSLCACACACVLGERGERERGFHVGGVRA